ncbi:hypothetical protein ACSS7Z_09905 [Microbacterium sp. A82]|uniref:hypothetical protein n=1 Tax=Microbacterium sp. A82 TaxID=3450452 RepID=UPI003F3ADFFC
MRREITLGWPEEHAGVRDVLGPGYIKWAGLPRIVENDNGNWLWIARPQFLDEQVFDDFLNLRDAGYQISIRPAGDRLLITIREEETS